MDKKRMATIYDFLRFTREHCKYVMCADCPLSSDNNKPRITCYDFMHQCTDEYNNYILKWIDEHPIKTYADDFFEHFPNASKHHNNYPIACRQHIYGGECNIKTCLACWNQPYVGK